MRLSLLFSLALGLIAVLAMSERIPRWRDGDPPAERALGSISPMITRATIVPANDLPPEQVTAPSKEHGRIYRWRDVRGGIHIATEPPPENVQAVVIPFVRKLPAKPEPRTEIAASVSTGTVPDLSPTAFLSVYTPEGFDDLLDRVEETARKLHQRSTQLELLEKQL